MFRAHAIEKVTGNTVRMQIWLTNAITVKPRKNVTLAVEVVDVEKMTADISDTVAAHGGSLFQAQVMHKRGGGDAAKLVFDVPLRTAAEVVEKLKEAGRIRVQESSENSKGVDLALEVARFDLSLSTDSIALADHGLWPQISRGFSASILAILWSISWVGFALIVALPWGLLSFGGYWVYIRFPKSKRPFISKKDGRLVEEGVKAAGGTP